MELSNYSLKQLEEMVEKENDNEIKYRIIL